MQSSKDMEDAMEGPEASENLRTAVRERMRTRSSSRRRHRSAVRDQRSSRAASGMEESARMSHSPSSRGRSSGRTRMRGPSPSPCPSDGCSQTDEQDVAPLSIVTMSVCGSGLLGVDKEEEDDLSAAETCAPSSTTSDVDVGSSDEAEDGLAAAEVFAPVELWAELALPVEKPVAVDVPEVPPPPEAPQLRRRSTQRTPQRGWIPQPQPTPQVPAAHLESRPAGRSCRQCKQSWSGFGSICSSCRKAGPNGTVRQCVCCSTFFTGFRDRCEDCA